MIALPKDLDRRVEEIATKFPGEVVGIRYSVGDDFAGDPAIFFRVLLTDTASRHEALADVTDRIRETLWDDLQFNESDYFPYFNFRSKSEQDKLKDPQWPLPTTS